jgi:hypothetical protein
MQYQLVETLTQRAARTEKYTTLIRIVAKLGKQGLYRPKIT